MGVVFAQWFRGSLFPQSCAETEAPFEMSLARFKPKRGVVGKRVKPLRQPKEPSQVRNLFWMSLSWTSRPVVFRLSEKNPTQVGRGELRMRRWQVRVSGFRDQRQQLSKGQRQLQSFFGTSGVRSVVVLCFCFPGDLEAGSM